MRVSQGANKHIRIILSSEYLLTNKKPQPIFLRLSFKKLIWAETKHEKFQHTHMHTFYIVIN